MKKNCIRRGEIYLVDLSSSSGSEQSGLRPVLIIQNDIGNQHSPTVIIAACVPLYSGTASASERKYCLW